MAGNEGRAAGEGMDAVNDLAERVKSTDPEAAVEVRAIGGRAVAYGLEGCYDEAVKEYLKMLDVAPFSLPVYRHVALELVVFERIGAAVEVCDEAVQFNGADAEAYRLLGEVCWQAGLYGVAALAYHEAVELGASSAEGVYLPLGHSYFSLRRYERAAQAFGEAARISSDSAEAHLYLGHSLFELKQYGRAAEAYRHAVALDPDAAPTRLSLSLTCVETGDKAEASAELKKCLELGGYYDGRLHGALGRALSSLGMFAEAARAYEESVRRWPGCGDCAADLARVYESAGWREEVEALRARPARQARQADESDQPF
jgi:tetratricopeptide (TPR) repeat protein